ncbi:MAG: 2-phospho-L-lactate guanylyltransferase [Anaerolineae bacterium]|nr:2-phospho-L-lactate guanylyltransferase [Anaerolineae bacterium]
MGVWVIIPVKPLDRAKSRLAQVLSPEDRRRLAERMFHHVLKAVRDVPQLMGTLVISRDSKVLAIARDYGARTVQESGTPELNSALMRATQVVARWKASAVFILPADLPLVSSEDIRSMISMGNGDSAMVIATDQQGDGTNAMFIRPPGLIGYSYGPGSFRRHIEMAQQTGVKPVVYSSERLSLDIDVPDDLKSYTELSNGFLI